MRIIYLPSARDDLSWLREYYTDIFPQGAGKALEHLMKAEEMILRHPHAGCPSASRPRLREIPIPRTPFILIYRVTPQCIEILRVLDARSQGS